MLTYSKCRSGTEGTNVADPNNKHHVYSLKHLFFPFMRKKWLIDSRQNETKCVSVSGLECAFARVNGADIPKSQNEIVFAFFQAKKPPTHRLPELVTSALFNPTNNWHSITFRCCLYVRMFGLILLNIFH